MILSSCQKETSTTFTPAPGLDINDTVWVNKPISAGKTDSILSAFAYESPFLYVDSFNCTVGDTLNSNGPYGTQIILPPLVYANANGTAITSGYIKVELLILARKGDYIKTLIPTNAKNKILEAAKCYYIKLTKQGQEVFLQPNSFYSVKWNDSQATTSTNFFEGVMLQNPDSLFTWKYSTNGTVHPSYLGGSQMRGYEMFSNVTHWNGCLKYIDTSAGTNRINVSLPPNFTNKNTTVFAVFNNNYSVIRLTSDFGSRTFYATGVPNNSQITIVSISLIDNMFYLGKADANISNANVISVKPQPKSAKDISSFLDGL